MSAKAENRKYFIRKGRMNSQVNTNQTNNFPIGHKRNFTSTKDLEETTNTSLRFCIDNIKKSIKFDKVMVNLNKCIATNSV